MPNFQSKTSQFDGAVEFVSMTEELTRFRKKLESEADGLPVHVLEVNVADLLSDLCNHLGLGKKQHNKILGTNNVRYLEATQSVRVSPAIKH